MSHPSKKSSRYYHGDDKTKKKLDRKRSGTKYESWERRKKK